MLTWQENLGPDEMPPVWMWPIDDELKAWFEEVERARKEKYGGGSDSSSSDDSPDGGSMTQNEFAKGRR